jgi:hypothetical protein
VIDSFLAGSQHLMQLLDFAQKQKISKSFEAIHALF